MNRKIDNQMNHSLETEIGILNKNNEVPKQLWDYVRESIGFELPTRN